MHDLCNQVYTCFLCRFAEIAVLCCFTMLALLWLLRDPKFIPGWGVLFRADENGRRWWNRIIFRFPVSAVCHGANNYFIACMVNAWSLYCQCIVNVRSLSLWSMYVWSMYYQCIILSLYDQRICIVITVILWFSHSYFSDSSMALLVVFLLFSIPSHFCCKQSHKCS